ncbi:ecdysteroid 22-kinase family protein, partial [Bacteriovoracaceae bacterium]|nr:ecdysteroid 22-kinase family protein [Bacteriovoracaceae bacterium]
MDIKKEILKATGAKEIIDIQLIQKLWNNYGELLRVKLAGGHSESVILKHIKLPAKNTHPKGFNTDLSKLRKIKSYQVETTWYEKYNNINRAGAGPATAKKLASFQIEEEYFILLEDLSLAGFNKLITKANLSEIKIILSWLANFHAKFMQKDHAGLWDNGSYWHLETRPDELASLKDLKLKQAASLIDKKLSNTKYLTIIHGDAKLANFCFANDSTKVAAVDFQYVGRGCGMKDVAYFIGSCLSQELCQELEDEILDFYFSELLQNVQDLKVDKKELETQWRALYPLAWADFHRFLKGWSADHWKINSYSEQMIENATDSIMQELLATAKQACTGAGELIKSYWKKEFKINSKNGSTLSSSVVTEVDLLAQEKILKILKPSIDTYEL